MQHGVRSTSVQTITREAGVSNKWQIRLAALVRTFEADSGDERHGTAEWQLCFAATPMLCKDVGKRNREISWRITGTNGGRGFQIT